MFEGNLWVWIFGNRPMESLEWERKQRKKIDVTFSTRLICDIQTKYNKISNNKPTINEMQTNNTSKLRIFIESEPQKQRA